MIIMQKRIFSILMLLALILSVVPSVMAEGKVAVVANSIDIEMNPSLIALLKQNGLTVDYFGAKDSGYDAYDYIIILGGPDSSEHTGDISKKLLKEDDQNNLRNRKYRILYETSDFFKKNQKIFVLAGTDRDYTKAAVDMYATQIISKIKDTKTETKTSKNLTAQQLKQIVDSGEKIYFIDVRTFGEYSGGHIPGAVNIPYQKLGLRLEQIPKDMKVVLYCDTGDRALSGAVLLSQKNFDNIYVLKGNYAIYTNLN